jgi:predicted phage terminase large subunit-like protein
VEVEVRRLPLHDGQKAIVNSAARYRVASCGRRFGKTMLAGYWLAIRDEGSAAGGKRCAWFAPSYKLLMDAWNDIERTVRPLIRRVNKTEQRIELIGGGVIDFWTLEDPDAGRGRRYHRIVIDEAAHARRLREAWERAISPTLTDYRGEAWFVSTPNGMNYFHDLYQRGGNPEYPDWESFHLPSSANPFLPPEEIEARRIELPELVFLQEYLAEFVTFGGGLVKPEHLIDGTAPHGLPVALGVDLAISEREGADWTAIAAMSRDPATGIVYLREVERHRAGFNEVLNRIKAAAERWRPSIIAAEQTQYQAAVVQELTRTTSLPVRGVKPDRDKLTRFLPLLTRYEQGQVRHDPAGVPAWFREELLSFPEGRNDDGVDAAAYAFASLAVSPVTRIPGSINRTY